MNSEQKARELLAEELDLMSPTLADDVRAGNEKKRSPTAAALRAIARALEQPESRAITALKVTLFGVECYLPASIAQAVQERCDESALEQREGFVMVPREPTAEMVNAACAIKLRRLNEFAAGKDGSGIEAGIREDYAAMLAAAPLPTPPKESE